jgi:hypothetical protein
MYPSYVETELENVGNYLTEYSGYHFIDPINN